MGAGLGTWDPSLQVTNCTAQGREKSHNNIVLSTLVTAGIGGAWSYKCMFQKNQPQESLAIINVSYLRECFLFPEGLTFLWFSGLSSEVSAWRIRPQLFAYWVTSWYYSLVTLKKPTQTNKKQKTKFFLDYVDKGGEIGDPMLSWPSPAEICSF